MGRTDDPADAAPSLFEQFCAEAVPPFRLELDDGPDVLTWLIPAPDADGVCELDAGAHPRDVISTLLGDGDVADEVLDALDPLPWARTLETAVGLRAHFALATLPSGLWTHLVERIDLYGEQIEADLSDRGHDLLDWFRGRRPWPQLIRLTDRLPDGSRFRAALADDEDLARERIESGAEPAAARSRPPLEGETQDRMLLRAAVTGLLRVEHAVYAAQAGNKAGRPPPPLPGPETAEDRLRAAYEMAGVEDIFDQVSPGWRDGI